MEANGRGTEHGIPMALRIEAGDLDGVAPACALDSLGIASVFLFRPGSSLFLLHHQSTRAVVSLDGRSAWSFWPYISLKEALGHGAWRGER
jgi:hypothetical protein